MKYLKKGCWLLVLLVIFYSFSESCQAGELEKATFEVEVISCGLAQTNAGYFSCELRPGESQMLIAKLKNTSSVQQDIQIVSRDAENMPTGEINYLGKNEKKLPVSVRQAVKWRADCVTLEVGQEQIVVADVQVPADFSGCLLGSSQFIGQCADDVEENVAGVRQQQSITLAILLETPSLPVAKLKLQQVGISKNQQVLNLWLDNQVAFFLSDLQLEVTFEDPVDGFQKTVKKTIAMVPTSQTKTMLPLPDAFRKIKKYKLSINAKNGPDSWHWETTIRKKPAKIVWLGMVVALIGSVCFFIHIKGRERAKGK